MHVPLIRPGTEADLERLVAVEVEAGQVFRTVGMTQIAEDVPEIPDLRAAAEEERLWVTEVGSEVAGYVSAEVLHSNGDALDIAVQDGRIVGVRGRADDRVNRGRLGPEGPLRLAGQPLARPAHHARWSGADGELVETDWDTAMDRGRRPRRELLDEQGPERDRLLHHGPALPRGVLHARA